MDDGHVGGGGLASRREGASDAFVFTIASSFFSAQRATGDGRWSTRMMRRLDFKWTAWNNPKVISKCRNRSRHTMQLCRCQSAILTHRVCVLGAKHREFRQQKERLRELRPIWVALMLDLNDYHKNVG